jgi:hypothetical protein
MVSDTKVIYSLNKCYNKKFCFHFCLPRFKKVMDNVESQRCFVINVSVFIEYKRLIFAETRSYHVAQAGLLFSILLPKPPQCQITSVNHHTQLVGNF